MPCAKWSHLLSMALSILEEGRGFGLLCSGRSCSVSVAAVWAADEWHWRAVVRLTWLIKGGSQHARGTGG